MTDPLINTVSTDGSQVNVAADGPTYSTPAGDTVAGNTSTTATIAVGGTVAGFVNTSGDHDWYAVQLVAGQTYAFTLNASATSLDPLLRLRSATGAIVAENDDSAGLNSRIGYTATSTGTFYLDAGAFNDVSTGGYNLSAAIYTIPVYTTNQVAEYLTTGYWGGDVAHWTPGSTITYNVQGLLPAAQVLARAALAQWQAVANLSFVETTGSASITFDDTGGGAYADSSSFGGVTISGNVNVQQNWSGELTPGLDSYTYQTFIHEIGHVLGLGHGGPYNGGGTYGSSNIYQNDTWAATVMSYFDQSNYNNGSYRYVMTPMIADIVAVQNIYGANASTRSGDTIYGHNSNAGSVFNFATFTTAPSFTIWDGGGTDTLDASGYTNDQTINLTAESSSSIGGLRLNVHIARGAAIENAIGGSGADSITGNSAANQLTGGIGNDTLDAGGGNDSLYGGDGADVLIAREGNDLVYGGIGSDTIDGGNGNDVVLAGDGDDRLYGYLGDDAIYGQAGQDFVYGDGGNDTLTGDAGNDDVRGAAGNDNIWGGSGNDYYFGGADADQLFLMDGGIITNEFDAVLDLQDTDLGAIVNDYLVLPAASRYASIVFDQGGYTWIASWDPAAPAGLHYNAIVGTSATAVLNNIVYI
jgi:serralysin